MYGSNVAAFLKLMVKNGELTINREDEIIRETLVTHGGEIVNARVSELVGTTAAAMPAGERR
jgi:NAD(P) transhydrogenase subunit alpha